MTLPAKKKLKIINFADFTGGVNLNDPVIGLSDNQVADMLNIIVTRRGFKRWPGCEGLTAQGAVDDVLKGLFHHSTISSAQYLYELHGGKLYSINKGTGVLSSALYDLTGGGEGYGCSSHGTFFLTNGVSMVKAEAGVAYQVGIAAPTGVTAVAVTSGGSLADGTYKLYASYARRSGGIDLLYSKGQEIADVVVSGGGGSGKITISSFSNSGDAQVGNKVIWMTDTGGSTYYLWDSTGDNTTTTWDITAATPLTTAITYSAYAANNDLPEQFTYVLAFNNRLFGIKDNKLYYSQKGATVYDLEKWPAKNVNTYPYKLTMLFVCGGHLCLNTEQNGVMYQPFGDVAVKYEHRETKTSYKYVRTVDEWGGNKIGLTSDRVGVFRGESMTFEPFDYGYNIRPVLQSVWGGSTYEPCGVVYRRENRIEYQLSVVNSDINETNSNRTYVLNLSRVFIYDNDRFKFPWEIVGRGYDKVCVDAGNVIYYGQSYAGASTVYQELLTHTTEVGLYNDSGAYVSTAVSMEMFIKSRTIIEDMFTKQIIESARAMFRIFEASSLLLTIEDDPGRKIGQETEAYSYGESLWDVFLWADDSGGDTWSSENIRQYEFKGSLGMFGYSWSVVFSQTADDIDFELVQLDVLVTLETGKGI